MLWRNQKLMDTKVFFSELMKFDLEAIGKCSRDIQNFFQSLNRNRNISNVRFLGYYTQDLICIRCEVKVDIPSRGTVADIDIRKEEPILLLIDIKEYPYKAPYVFTDRIDFPYTRLPHMIVYSKYSLKGLCLHRGNINDWFSEHTVEDFIIRIRAWFRDAASNRLIKENDQFEPTRVYEEEGYIIYEPDCIIKFIKNYWENNKGERDFGFFAFKLGEEHDTKEQEKMPSIEVLHLYLRREYRKMLDDYNQALLSKDNSDFHLGILVWCSSRKVNSNYFDKLPVRIDDLIAFGELIDCKVGQAINFYTKRLKNRIIGVPIICALNRPDKLIGSESNVELLNMVFDGTQKDTLGNYKMDLPVYILTNRTPITSEYAKKLSDIHSNNNPSILIVGCGALGSKMSTHLSRSGHNKQFIVDDDKLQPHNIIRHALFFESIGRNKAETLAQKFSGYYRHDSESDYSYSDKSVFELIADNSTITNEKFDILCDFSASSSVFNCLVNADRRIPRVIKAEIGYHGKIGVMYIEGMERNPRIDDIQAMLFHHANNIVEISKWFTDYKNQRDNLGEAEFEEITVGLGCNSSTMKLADDVISQHAATLSLKLRELMSTEDSEGKLIINYLDVDNIENNFAKILKVPPFVVKNSTCGEWKIRISMNVYNHIMNELAKHSPNETGGILIGHINVKEKTIHIVDTFTPKDSERYPYAFVRGIKDVPQYIKTITKSTGGLIGYAGEWHTHPKMGLFMSDKDLNSYDEIRENLRKANLPTHIAIFNENDFKCFIY